MTKPGLVKSRAPSNQPCWKTSVISPNATPTEARFSTAEISAIGTLRNVDAHHQQGQQQHEADHQRQPGLLALDEVEGLGGVAADGVLDPGQPVEGGGCQRRRAAP